MADGITTPVFAMLHWVLWVGCALAIGGGAACALILRASEADLPRDPSGDHPRDLVDAIIEKLLEWCRGGWRLQPARLRPSSRDRSRPLRDH